VSSYLINTYILVPFEMEYLRTIAFIVTIAGVVGFTELVKTTYTNTEVLTTELVKTTGTNTEVLTTER
jgi:Na+-translocating ferredoxin:NAD+ oxidoreductase RnfA subunit